MDKFEGLMHVLTIAGPPLEDITTPQKAVDLAKIANDEMAELMFQYPDRFAAAIAWLPMNNMDEALKETDRCIKDLKFRGIQIYTPTMDRPIDSPEFLPLYEKMAEYNLPIWIHPTRPINISDYRSEKTSLYRIYWYFGWPYETSVAMARLVMSGILEKYPNLKFITHHAGGMIPFFEKRIVCGLDHTEMLQKSNFKEKLRRPVLEYFKMFYADTAIAASIPALECANTFFGADHMLFGTDWPFDSQRGERSTREGIEAIEQMNITDAQKKMIFEENARKIMRLAV
ncbi:MAG: amidohydrolase family protein, partial [Chloroflexota bacterium]|nr:amidohydrolase family protein [Chloroflexota bacterium]